MYEGMFRAPAAVIAFITLVVKKTTWIGIRVRLAWPRLAWRGFAWLREWMLEVAAAPRSWPAAVSIHFDLIQLASIPRTKDCDGTEQLDKKILLSNLLRATITMGPVHYSNFFASFSCVNLISMKTRTCTPSFVPSLPLCCCYCCC
jgi:hypothetical protein